MSHKLNKPYWTNSLTLFVCSADVLLKIIRKRKAKERAQKTHNWGRKLVLRDKPRMLEDRKERSSVVNFKKKKKLLEERKPAWKESSAIWWPSQRLEAVPFWIVWLIPWDQSRKQVRKKFPEKNLSVNRVVGSQGLVKGWVNDTKWDCLAWTFVTDKSVSQNSSVSSRQFHCRALKGLQWGCVVWKSKKLGLEGGTCEGKSL